MQTTKITIATAGLGFFIGITAGMGGCRGSEPNPNHCARQDGDAACEEKFGGDLPYCWMCGEAVSANDGCAAEMPEDLNCYSPCGDMQNFNENASCIETGDGDGDGDGDGEGDGDGDGDGEPMPCMGPEDCTDPVNAFCHPNTGECVPCDALPDSDVLCASLGDGSTPVCVEGMCVECAEGKEQACEALTPVCDGAANMCVGCSTHEQCPDSACNLAAGNCIDPANIVHVDGGFLNCNMGDGSEAMPFCTLGVGLVNAPPEAVIMIYAKPGEASYQEANTISNTRAIFGVPDANGKPPILQGFNNSPAITVAVAGSLFLRDVQISGSPVEGLAVAGGQAWLQAARVINNSGGGITVDSGGTLFATNSFAGGMSSSPALDITDGTVDVTYSTLGLAPAIPMPAFRCSANGAGSVRNSIVLTSNGSEIACDGVMVETSAVSMSLGDNTVLGPLNIGWFDGYLAGDFHLSGTHPAAINTAATWQTGDPAQDIDGDARPNTNGASDVAGADVP